VLTEKVWEHIQKIAILKQLQTQCIASFKLILKQNVKNVWERRSHSFPPHNTLANKQNIPQCLEILVTVP